MLILVKKLMTWPKIYQEDKKEDFPLLLPLLEIPN